MFTGIAKKIGLVSLPVKIGCMAIAFAAITLAASKVEQTFAANSFTIKTEFTTLQLESEILAYLAADAMKRDDLAELDRMASAFFKDTSLDAVAILGPDGQPRVSRGGAASILYDRELTEFLKSSSNVQYYKGATISISPVRMEGQTLGSVIVRSPEPHNAHLTAGGLGQGLFISILILLALTPLAFAMARYLLSPFKHAAQSVSTGEAEGVQTVFDVMDNLDEDWSNAVKQTVQQYSDQSKKYRKLAMTDTVTGLANRTHFMHVMDHRIKQAGERTIALVLLDINRFHKVNAAVGPRAADLVLKEIAQRIHATLQQTDKLMRSDVFEQAPSFVGRLGADQFAISIPFSDDVTIERITKSIVVEVKRPMEIDGRRLELKIDVSASCSPRDADTATELLKQAELAMKRAKEKRDRQLFFYDKSLAEDANDQMRLEDEIRSGVERGEFVAVYQPKIELETGEVIGAEALARWRRPDGEVVSPGKFIPKAEEMGLIAKLGTSVLRDACMAAAKWNFGTRPVRVAVNVSPFQFEDPNFIPAVYEILDESGIRPECLELEVTETAAVENPEKVVRIMRPLRAKGVRLAIDDFGTGHSNFTTVTRLPFDVFKIDQQFVKALSTDPHAPAIIEMILAMAETLDQETVAEGVETMEQFDFLRRRACTIGQGYLFSPPLPGHEFQSYVNHWRSSSLIKRSA